jgi:hypothetical protein
LINNFLAAAPDILKFGYFYRFLDSDLAETSQLPNPINRKMLTRIKLTIAFVNPYKFHAGT